MERNTRPKGNHGPPLLALWLLERVDSYGNREALIGDLVEEIAQGRSRFWIWQQVLALCGLAAAGHVPMAHGPLT